MFQKPKKLNLNLIYQNYRNFPLVQFPFLWKLIWLFSNLSICSLNVQLKTHQTFLQFLALFKLSFSWVYLKPLQEMLFTNFHLIKSQISQITLYK